MELFFDFMLLAAVLIVGVGIVVGVVHAQRKTKQQQSEDASQ